MGAKPQIGFMQGRLSPPVNGMIQAFPWDHWQAEFATAQANGFGLMEWTLDQGRLHENPLMTAAGRSKISVLMQRHGVRVLSLTGDCFMQAPFYKADGAVRTVLLDDLRGVIAACAELKVRYIVVPLVDNGRLENAGQEEALIAGLKEVEPLLVSTGVKVIFESDYPPLRLRTFIDRLPVQYYGINYDIGNSASLGFDPVEEITTYGSRIDNVHVKDRVRAGTTVPLGSGNANFPAVFRELKRVGYAGCYILQTARATDGNHAGVLCHYRDMVVDWLKTD